MRTMRLMDLYSRGRPLRATAVLLASLALPAWALPLPAPGEWAYDISGQAKGLPYRASATLTWEHDAQRYCAQLSMRALLVGQRSQTSLGAVDIAGLRPESFVDRGRKERRYELDWAAKRYRVPPDDAAHALPVGSQDRLSLFLQLAAVLGQQRTPPATGQTWQLPVLSAGGTHTWTFVWKGTETLDLPAGRHTAWRLDRVPREPGDTQVSLWFAPPLQFLPVRIRLTEPNGDTVDQRLSQVRPKP